MGMEAKRETSASLTYLAVVMHTASLERKYLKYVCTAYVHSLPGMVQQEPFCMLQPMADLLIVRANRTLPNASSYPMVPAPKRRRVFSGYATFWTELDDPVVHRCHTRHRGFKHGPRQVLNFNHSGVLFYSSREIFTTLRNPMYHAFHALQRPVNCGEVGRFHVRHPGVSAT